MPFKLHDRVRLRPDSAFRLGEPWEDDAGEVVAVFDDVRPARLNVFYGLESPFLSTVLASEFEPAAAEAIH